MRENSPVSVRVGPICLSQASQVFWMSQRHMIIIYSTFFSVRSNGPLDLLLAKEAVILTDYRNYF